MCDLLALQGHLALPGSSAEEPALKMIYRDASLVMGCSR